MAISQTEHKRRFTVSSLSEIQIEVPTKSHPTRNEDEYGSWQELSIRDRVVTVNEDTGEIVSVWTENEGNRPINKPFRTPNGPKKFAVYTKNDKGNVVLVRFGDSNMEIKRDNKERRKSFRARHGCDTDPGPKWKAKYWSCRMWEKGKSVASVLNEDQVDNVFCPTGKGGGVDPTCSPKNPATVEGLRWYKYHGYSSINKGLRTGKLTKNADKAVKIIDGLFEPADKDMVVYRGVKWGKTGETVKKLQSIKEGDEFYDAAYASTSSKDSVARKFAKNHNVVVVYEIPKGFPIINVESILGLRGALEDEGEVLLPRGSTWITQSVSSIEGGIGLRITMSPKKEWTVTDNVFCPTGKGGGVDPTCSPGGFRTLSSGEVLQSATRKDKTWVLADGSPVPSHIQNMKPPIPPAWSEVHVNLDPEATVLVQGRDKKGRMQSRYSDSHSAQATASKFGRVRELRQKRSEIYKELKQDAKDSKLKENAECLELVMRTGIRPGGGDTGADYEAFGATSLKGSHVRVGPQGDVSLVFVPGKSKGKEKVFPVDDSRLSKILQRRAKKAGQDGNLFNTSPGSLRNYSKSKDGGGFKTKDHRTALGTEVAIAEIKKIGTRTKFTSQSEYKKAVKQVAVKVSEVLGNTPNVALKSYIDPTVFSGWKPPKMRKK